MDERFDIMVVAAHPDDAEFGAAGTIARWIREGKKAVYVICTNGDKGTSDFSIRPDALAKLRQAEQIAAARTIGVNEVVFLNYRDQELEDTPALRKDIVRQIRIFRPHTLMTSDPYRRYIWHRDHRIAGQVTLDAIYPYARDILAYPDLAREGIMPHKVAEVLTWGSDDPNYYSDITGTFELKIAALKCHRSQVGERPDLAERLRARYRAMAEGQPFELAEAFHRVEAPD